MGGRVSNFVLLYLRMNSSSSLIVTPSISPQSCHQIQFTCWYSSIGIIWKWRQLESRCLRKQRVIPLETRKTLERVSNSRGLGLVKKPQPARPRGRKEAIKRPASGLSAGYQLTFIMSWNNYMQGWWQRQREMEKEIEIEMEVDGWCDAGLGLGLAGPPLRKGAGYQDRRLPTGVWLSPGGPGRAL